MSVTVRIPQAISKGIRWLLHREPDLVLTGELGIRRSDFGTEFLVRGIRREMPLFASEAGGIPVLRIFRMTRGGGWRTWPSQVSRAFGSLLDLALDLNGRFVGVWTTEGRGQPVERFQIAGAGMRTHFRPGGEAGRRRVRRTRQWEARFSREIGALGGPDVFARFQESSYAVVGAGRTGSLVAHDLARRQVMAITVVDPDVTLEWNIPAGDLAATAQRGAPKVYELDRFLRKLGLTPHVRAIPTSLLDPSAIEAVLASDVLVTCVDDQDARLQASLIATLYLKPHLDLGTGFLWRPDGSVRVGFDVRMLTGDDGCLLCCGGLRGIGGGRRRAEDFREQRAGSSRSLNHEAVGRGMRLLERFFEGTIERSVRQVGTEDESGADVLISTSRTERSDCPICALRGLGDLGGSRIPRFAQARGGLRFEAWDGPPA